MPEHLRFRSKRRNPSFVCDAYLIFRAVGNSQHRLSLVALPFQWFLVTVQSIAVTADGHPLRNVEDEVRANLIQIS